MKTEKLLTTRDAAALLCVSVAFLERDRWAGARIPFVKIGSRAVRYRLSDLEQFIVARRSSAMTDAPSTASEPRA